MDKYPWQKRERERKEKKNIPKKTVYQKFRKRTKEGSKEDRLYMKLRDKFLEDHPVCQCGRPGCTNVATEVHHKKGHGIWYLIVATFLAVCHKCHRWIETHPEEAKKLGYSESRLAK